MNRALRVMSDSQGTVVAGFLGPRVYYIRVIGVVSSALGIRCATQIRQHLGDANGVTCFSDTAAATGTDFAARSAIMRAFLANRRQLTAIKLLVGPGQAEARARTMTGMLDTPTHVMTSSALFHAQLLEAAPTAPSQLPASGRIPIARSIRPPRGRSMRPRARTGTHG